MKLRVGLVQLRTPATQEAALDHVLPLVRQAAAGGAQFILTPEGTNILQRDREQLLPRLGPGWQRTVDEFHPVRHLHTWTDLAPQRRRIYEKR